MMQLQDILYSQGFGIRRVCSGLVQQGWVEIWDSEQQAFVPVRDSMLELEPVGLRFRVQGVEWHYQAKGYIMLHKPAGTECSQKPSAWPSIYSFAAAAVAPAALQGGHPGRASGGAAGPGYDWAAAAQ